MMNESQRPRLSKDTGMSPDRHILNQLPDPCNTWKLKTDSLIQITIIDKIRSREVNRIRADLEKRFQQSRYGGRSIMCMSTQGSTPGSI
jgi:hypothetical protein